jgi:hypothetical protein
VKVVDIFVFKLIFLHWSWSSMEVLGILAKDVFMFNRENFMFDKEVNMNRLFQLMKMRIEACDLYREDLRDLFDLTIVKMDNYLIVNSLTLIFTMGFFYEGRLPAETPAWLMWLWATNLAAAILFLVLSVWFAIHAAIAAQTFSVRLLTQWLRLPVPTRADVEAAKPSLEQFEQSKLQEMLRLPVISEYLKDMLRTGTSETEEEYIQERSAVRQALEKNYDQFVDHFVLFQRLQKSFTGYDAYTRVTLVVGAAHLFYVVGYMALANYMLALRQIGALAFIVGIIAFSIVHARHNLILTIKEHWLFALALTMGPLLASVMAIAKLKDEHTSVPDYLAPFAFAAHLLVTLAYFLLGFEATNELPTRFSTVVAIDILGEHENATAEGAPEEPQQMRLQFFSRRRQQKARGNFPGLSQVPLDSGIQEALSKARQASTIDSALGGEVAPSSGPQATLPWTCFRIAGAAIVLVWLGSIVWSALVAFGIHLWRWESVIEPNSRPAQRVNDYLKIQSDVIGN